MAKGSVSYKNPKGVYTVGDKSSLPADVGKRLSNQTSVLRNPKGVYTVGDKSSLPKNVANNLYGTKIGAVANKYASPIGPSNARPAKQQKVSVSGGLGIQGFNGGDDKHFKINPKATARQRNSLYGPNASPKAAAKASPKSAVVRTSTNFKASPVKTKMAVNRFTGNTTGFTTGKVTGTSVSKAGVASRTPGSNYSRMQSAAKTKSGSIGPSRSGKK